MTSLLVLDKEFRKKFVVERQGREFILYAGLVVLAGQKGLISLKVTPLEWPCEGNGYTCYTTATALFLRDEQTFEFTDIADANVKNVGDSMRGCVPRMAATRAKARVLRDGIGIDMVSVEELDGSEEAAAPKSAPRAVSSAPKPATPVAPSQTPKAAPAPPVAAPQAQNAPQSKAGGSRHEAYHALVDLPTFPEFEHETARNVFVVHLAGKRAGTIIKNLTVADLQAALSEFLARQQAATAWDTQLQNLYGGPIAPEAEREVIVKLGIKAEPHLITAAQWKVITAKLPEQLERWAKQAAAR